MTKSLMESPFLKFRLFDEAFFIIFELSALSSDAGQAHQIAEYEKLQS